MGWWGGLVGLVEGHAAPGHRDTTATGQWTQVGVPEGCLRVFFLGGTWG